MKKITRHYHLVPEIFQLIFDLYVAGTETTSSTLRWMMLFLIRNPDVQKKCRQEIHNVS